VFSENAGDRAAPDLVSQIGHCSLDPCVPPRSILKRHAQNEIDDRLHDARPTGASTMAVVPFTCDHFSVPSQEGSGASGDFGPGKARSRTEDRPERRLRPTYGLLSADAPEPAENSDQKMIERGKYLILIANCNDCHTQGYLLKDGKVPVSEWLKGNSLGWRGPWGTTYPRNLRLFVKDLSEAQWVEQVKSLTRLPPMPWFNVSKMHDDDLRAIYHFIKSLGEPGEQAPAFIPADQEPPMPYITVPGPPPPDK
jgi:mono/diheme cytochrome c family protein